MADARLLANPQTTSQFGSESATRLREAGFASNRASAMARERIHRAMADARLLANPASRSRVADSDPN